MIEEIIEEYKQINLEIIKSIKEDREEVELLEKREKIIADMLSGFIDKQKIKRLYIENGLDQLDYQLQKVLDNKINNVKNNIKKIALRKEANKVYNSVNRKLNFFSTNV